MASIPYLGADSACARTTFRQALEHLAHSHTSPELYRSDAPMKTAIRFSGCALAVLLGCAIGHLTTEPGQQSSPVIQFLDSESRMLTENE